MNSETTTLKFSWKHKLFFIGFGLLCGFGALEAASRILAQGKAGSEFGSVEDLRSAIVDPAFQDTAATGGNVNLKAIINPHPDNRIIYDLLPNLDVKFQDVKVTTNSCGMRGPERSIEKAPNVYRIALLGDSFTFGWGVEQTKAFPQILEDTLNHSYRNSEMRFEVLNFGVPGYSTFQEVFRFLESGKEFNPDAVVVFFIENDFGMPFFIRDVENPQGIMSSLSFARLLQDRIDPKLREHSLEVQRLDPSSSITALSDYTRANGIKLSVAFNPKKEWRSDLSRIRVLHQRKDIQIMPLRDNFMRIVEREHIDPKALTLPTDPHPSELKHKMLGELIAPYFFGIPQ